MRTLIRLVLISRFALVAENLFLRKQLALFAERKIEPRRGKGTRLVLIALSRFFDWHEALVIVKAATFVGWHRTAFRLFWRWKSRKRGRRALPANIRTLIREMARENPTWGERRIADELDLKLGIKVSHEPCGSISDRVPAGPPGSAGARSSAITQSNRRLRFLQKRRKEAIPPCQDDPPLYAYGNRLPSHQRERAGITLYHRVDSSV